MKKTTDHKFVRFVSRRGEISFGFECGTKAKQVLVDSTERVVTATCYACGKPVAFDAGRFRWRLWFLPKKTFTTARRRKLLVLDAGWNGETRYSPES